MKKTPLPSRSKRRPRKPRPACTVRGCKRSPRALGLCLTHAKRKADSLFSAKVRERLGGRCQRCGQFGSIQCAHLISRRYLATRWMLLNAEPLCAGCHTFLTHRPLEHELWCVGVLGDRWAWEGLKRIALEGGKPDYARILLALGYREVGDE